MSPPDPSWVLPYWLERQHDPANPEFVPGAPAAEAPNVTHRNGTIIGNLATAPRALVDPRGLVTPSRRSGRDRSWSLDWWIGAEDRWHIPARSVAVRQRLVDGAPVVETAMRVPGGDALHRAYAMVSTTAGPCVVVEIENRTAVPFALALAVRPYDPLGYGWVSSIGSVGATVRIDGEPVLLFDRAPGRVVLSSGAEGDCGEALFAGATPPASAGGDAGGTREARDDRGRASGAFVFALPHTAVLRAVLPLSPLRSGSSPRPSVSRRRPPRPAAPAPPGFPDAVPSAGQVARGWEIQTRRGLQIEVPDARLTQALDTARRHLLLVHGGEDLVTWPARPFAVADAAAVVRTLDQFGFAAEADQVLTSWGRHQSLDGRFSGRVAGLAKRMDANGAALDALAEHWRLTRDGEPIRRLVGPIAKALRWVDRQRTHRRSRPAGLLPEGPGPPGAGPVGVYFSDTALSVRGLTGIAEALDAIDQPGVATEARRIAATLGADLDAALALTASRDHDEALPPTPERRADAGVVDALSLAQPFGVLPPGGPRMVATLDLIRRQWMHEGAVFRGSDHVGLSPFLTLHLALVELEAGDRRALDRLQWLLDTAGPTVAWPTAIHPRTGGGSAGDPHDPAATALFLSFVRRLLVRETPEGTGLVLCSILPGSWIGHPIDVRHAPTASGPMSFSVRWHGERPALLWDLELHPGITSATLRAPGLDPSWSTTASRGEQLLGVPAATAAPAAPAAPAVAPAGPGGESFS